MAQTNFSLIKQKIIKTNDILQMYQQKNVELKELKETNKQLNTKFSSIKVEMERIAFEKNRFQHNYNELLQKHEPLVKERDELKEQYSLLENRFSAICKDLQTKYENTKKELDENKKQLRKQERSIHDKEKGANDHLQKKIEQLSKENKLLKDEIMNLKQKIESYQDNRRVLQLVEQDLRDRRIDLQKVQMNCREYQNSILILKEELNKEKHLRTDLEKEVEKLRNEANEYMKEILILKEKSDERNTESIERESDLYFSNEDNLNIENNQQDEEKKEETPTDECVGDILKEMVLGSPMRAVTPLAEEEYRKKASPIVRKFKSSSGDFTVSSLMNLEEIVSPIIRRKRKKRIIKKKNNKDVDLLAALKVLNKANIHYIIHNEPILPLKLLHGTPKLTRSHIEEFKCTQSNCTNSSRAVLKDNGDLIGFCPIKKEKDDSLTHLKGISDLLSKSLSKKRKKKVDLSEDMIGPEKRNKIVEDNKNVNSSLVSNESLICLEDVPEKEPLSTITPPLIRVNNLDCVNEEEKEKETNESSLNRENKKNPEGVTAIETEQSKDTEDAEESSVEVIEKETENESENTAASKEEDPEDSCLVIDCPEDTQENSDGTQIDERKEKCSNTLESNLEEIETISNKEAEDERTAEISPKKDKVLQADDNSEKLSEELQTPSKLKPNEVAKNKKVLRVRRKATALDIIKKSYYNQTKPKIQAIKERKIRKVNVKRHLMQTEHKEKIVKDAIEKPIERMEEKIIKENKDETQPVRKSMRLLIKQATSPEKPQNTKTRIRIKKEQESKGFSIDEIIKSSPQNTVIKKSVPVKKVIKPQEIKHQENPKLETTENSNYVIVKKAKFKIKVVNSLLDKLLNFASDDKLVDEIAENFLGQSPKYIAWALLERIASDYDKPEQGINSFTPILTVTQKIVLGFMYKLKKMGVNSICDNYLVLAEKRILSSPKLEEIDPITRLYTSICKLEQDLSKMRIFCCEVFYFCGDLAIPFFFTVLTIWSEVLPLAEDAKSNLLVRVLIHIVSMNNCFTEGYNRAALEDFLKRFYGYDLTKADTNEIFKEVLDGYLKKPERSTTLPLLLLFKYQTPYWVNEKIEQDLKPNLNHIKCENFKANYLILIGRMSIVFKKGSDVYKNGIVSWLNGLLDKENTSEVVKNSIRFCLNVLNK